MSFIIMYAGYALLVAGYYVFRNSTQTLCPPDPSRATPAVSINDGTDYVPTHTAVVTGHYYMSIAGLSPILSVIAGLIWGWVPAAIWLIVGVTLFGAPTEYMNIMVSLRNKGKTMGDIIYTEIGHLPGVFNGLLLGFGGMLVFSIFITVMSSTLETIPEAALSSIILIPIALLFAYLNRFRKMPLLFCTLVCCAVWAVFIVLGYMYPLTLNYTAWMWILFIYTLLATALPVWTLLQPRDFLNTSLLVVAVIVASLAILVGRPGIEFPAYVGWITKSGALFPAILATISCGALNGMHQMISAGMASKQLDNEKNAYTVVGIGTRGETVLAIIAGVIIMTQFNYSEYLDKVLTNIGGFFSEGFGGIVTYLGIPASIGVAFGALTIAAFTLTTMDSMARAGRYNIQELAEKSQIAKSIGLHTSSVSSILVVGFGFYMAWKLPFMDLWTGFVLTSLMYVMNSYYTITLLNMKEDKAKGTGFYLWVVVPGAIMFVSTIITFIYMLVRFINQASWMPVAIVIVLISCFAITFCYFVKRYNEIKMTKSNDAKAVPQLTK